MPDSITPKACRQANPPPARGVSSAPSRLEEAPAAAPSATEGELRRAKEALETSSARRLDFYGFGPVGYLTLDREGRVLEANPRAATLLGVERARLAGRRFGAFAAPEARPALADFFARIFAGSGPASCEVSLAAGAGRPRSVRVEAWLAEGGAACRAAVSDVTELAWAREERRKSEERCQLATASGRVGVWDWDVRANELIWDDQMYELYGVAREAFPGCVEAWEQGVHPDDRERAWRACEAALRGEGRYDVEFRVLRPDGEVRYVKADGIVTRDAAGSAVRMVGLNRDVTEARLAEESYQQLFREMIDGFALHEILLDPRGAPVDYRFLAVNPAFERLTGLRANAVVGRTVSEVLPGEDPFWVETYGRVALTGEPAHFEREASALGRHFAVTAYRPAPGQFAALFADVTERKRAEEALRLEVDRRLEAETKARESAELFRLLFEEAGDNIVLLRPRPDCSPVIVDMNRQGVRLHGFADKSELVGREMASLDAPDSAALAAERTRQILEEGELRFEVRHRTQDGRSVPLEVRARRIEIAGVPHVLAVERDLSERVELEARLRQAQKMEAIGTLAGGIAHDFNNILTPIMAHGELAQMQLPAGSPVRDHLSELLGAAGRAATLVKQILAISRRDDAGAPVPVNVGALVKETAQFLRASIPTTIELRVNVEAGCGPVLAEPAQLHQVLLNLCTNASYAMAERGGVLALSLRREEEGAGGGGPRRLRLTVADTGPGIPASVRARIFEPYFTTKPVGKGSGLGLAVVHGIVTSLGGEVRVTSAAGKGATFEVLLPETRPAAPGPGEGRAEVPRGGGQRVLVVDDEAAIRAVLSRMLSVLGYEVCAHAEAAGALDAFRSDPRAFHAVLTDYTMPGLNGLELAGRLLALRPDLPVLIGTGFSEAVDERVATEHGLRGLVTKPYDLRKLGEALAGALAPRDEGRGG